MSGSPRGGGRGGGGGRVPKKVPDFFVQGQQVVARFKGRDLYPGRIAAAQVFTKTYSVLYDDGDEEHNVPVHLIFPRLAVGTRVEAAFQAGATLYPGAISGVNEDSTYAVLYDDGDEEDEVQPEYVVPLVPTLEHAGSNGGEASAAANASSNGDISSASSPTSAAAAERSTAAATLATAAAGASSPAAGAAATTAAPTATPPAAATDVADAVQQQLQLTLARLLAMQQQQLQNQIYLSQQLAHSIRLLEQQAASAAAAAARAPFNGAHDDSGDGEVEEQHLLARVPVLGPNGEETSAVAVVRMRVVDDNGNGGAGGRGGGGGAAGGGEGGRGVAAARQAPRAPPRADMAGRGVGAGAAGGVGVAGGGGGVVVRRGRRGRRYVQWNAGFGDGDGDALLGAGGGAAGGGRRRRRGGRGLFGLTFRQLVLGLAGVLLVLAAVFKDTTLDYVDLLSVESAGFEKYASMQLWLQSGPANEPKHLCHGMSLKNLNPYDVEVRAFHVTDMESPQQTVVLGPNEVLKLPPYTRRTAYEVSRPTGTAPGGGSGGQRGRGSGSGRGGGTAAVHMYSFVFDPEVHGPSAVMRLRASGPTFSECLEFANGQFRPGTAATPLAAYRSFEDLRNSELL